jgi:hypothetical protein
MIHRSKISDGAIEMRLPLIEEERQAERYANEARRDDRHPTMSKAQAPALDLDKRDECDRREEDIQPKECADAIGKQVGDELTRCEAVSCEPRPERGVREDQSDYAESEKEVSRANRDAETAH